LARAVSDLGPRDEALALQTDAEREADQLGMAVRVKAAPPAHGLLGWPDA
jgi:hypothetical protein